MGLTPATAKRLSGEFDRIPFGTPTLDNRFRGLPSGSAVLLVGAPDSGIDSFAFTNAAQLMVARHYPGMYDGKIRTDPEALPDAVHVVTLSRRRDRLVHQMDAVLRSEGFNVLTDHLTVADFSPRYRALAPIPEPLAGDSDEGPAEPDVDVPTRPVEDDTFETLLADVCTHVDAVGDGDVVVLDSLTALTRATEFGLPEPDVTRLLVGLRDASTRWGGLVSVLYHHRPELVRADETINTALNGCLYFYCNDEGNSANKTMRVGSFGGALNQRQQVVYDTAVTGDGFRVRSTQSY